MTTAPAGPVEGLRPPGERPRDEDRRTRKPLSFWDRVKFLLLLVLATYPGRWYQPGLTPSLLRLR